MIILITTKEDKNLVHTEIEALGYKIISSQENILSCKDQNNKNYERSVFINFAFKPIKTIPKINSFKFVFDYTSRKESIPFIEQIAKTGAEVKLKDPQKTFAIINNKLHELIYTNKKEYHKRNPKSRPGFHPGACTAKFARMLVNLTGVKEEETISDPFCGTGGVLIEAALMNIKALGSDLNESMLKKAKQNIEYYKIQDKIIIEENDALKITQKCDAIATELPFGKSTKIKSTVPDLTKQFLNNAKKITNKIAIALPSGHQYNFEDWNCISEHHIYIHKSLSKEIYVLEQLQ